MLLLSLGGDLKRLVDLRIGGREEDAVCGLDSQHLVAGRQVKPLCKVLRKRAPMDPPIRRSLTCRTMRASSSGIRVLYTLRPDYKRMESPCLPEELLPSVGADTARGSAVGRRPGCGPRSSC